MDVWIWFPIVGLAVFLMLNGACRARSRSAPYRRSDGPRRSETPLGEPTSPTADSRRDPLPNVAKEPSSLDRSVAQEDALRIRRPERSEGSGSPGR
jgi:hypothetical protein